MDYSPSDFHWIVRKVFNWSGQMEIMIELVGVDGCVAYGDTILEAKVELASALCLWIRNYGEQQLPDIHHTAQIIYLEQPMTIAEFRFVNQELKKLT